MRLTTTISALAPTLLFAACMDAPDVASVDGAEIHITRHGDGAPYFAQGSLAIVPPASPPQVLAAEVAPLFGLASEALIVERAETDALGATHVIYQRQHAGLPVIGGRLAVHLDADGVVYAANAAVARNEAPSSSPSIAENLAEAQALDATHGTELRAGDPELTYVISGRDRGLYLAWRVPVTGSHDGLPVRDDVFVDAHAGTVVARHAHIHTARNRQVYDLDGELTYYANQPATPVLAEGAVTPSGDPIADAAYDNTGVSYDCFSTLFGRDSYDGAGSPLISWVHGLLGNGDSNQQVNAYWDGVKMVYGNGDGQNALPLAQALDVTVHELTHGVTQYSANLVYEYESGALNEAMSDIMAATCEAWARGGIGPGTWLVGEDIWTPGVDGDALRYMDDPTRDAASLPDGLSSADYYPDRYQGDFDNGGVHLNSGIANLAFTLLARGGTHPRGKSELTIQALGIENAAKIFYRALTAGYLQPTATFAEARIATEQAATDLFGPFQTAVVGRAWAAVGVGQPPVDTLPPTVEITSPADGEQLQGPVTVTVDAADDSGVVDVTLVVDGTDVETLASAPFEFSLNTLLPGEHVIEARASDGPRSTTDRITVTVLPETECDAQRPCGDGEICDAVGMCVPDPSAGGGAAGNEDLQGGCSAGGGSTGPASILLLALVVLARRRGRA